MYKLIAIDLDGTMLNSYGEISQKTKRTIKETMLKGVNIVIASGRSIDSIKNIAEETNASPYIIAGNGAVVYDRIENKILYEKYIPKQKALDIIKICEENSIFYNVYTNKSIIANSLRYNVLYYYKENLKKEEEKRTSIKLVDNIERYITEMREEKVMKIFICDSNKVIFNSIIRKFDNMNDLDVLDVSHMSRKIIKRGTVEIPIEYYYTEISMKDVDKWYGVEFLARKLGVKNEEVMAIGDNSNDKKMIEEAGLGITMQGSTKQVIDIADYVTDTNDNDGVAKAIEKFLV